MNKIITSSVVAIGLFVSASSANAADFDPPQSIQELVVSGVVESWSGYSFYTNKDFDGDEDDLEDSFFTGKSGRLSLPLGGAWSVQMDVDAEFNTTHLFKSNDDNTTNMEYAFQGLAHFSARDPGMGLIGVFGGAGEGAADGDEYPFYVIGGEAQLYLQDFTFYVQGGYFDITSRGPSHDEDALQDAIFGRGVVRWFLDENTRLQGEVSYADGTSDANEAGVGDDGNVIEWGVRYDTTLAGLPVIGDTNVFLGYRGAKFSNDDEDNSFVDHTIMAGFRYAFGGNSLKEIDRVGATLDAPMIGRWVGSGNIVD
jgi:hypothetical protein